MDDLDADRCQVAQADLDRNDSRAERRDDLENECGQERDAQNSERGPSVALARVTHRSRLSAAAYAGSPNPLRV